MFVALMSRFRARATLEVFIHLPKLSFQIAVRRQPRILITSNFLFLFTFSSSFIWLYVSKAFNFNTFDAVVFMSVNIGLL